MVIAPYFLVEFHFEKVICQSFFTINSTIVIDRNLVKLLNVNDEINYTIFDRTSTAFKI